ncbi:prosaposin-like isoform X2 [Pollicipes pollicipes]|uniref:prosaposin-like isoform X2 n=2 Tax=Pollicipes pollicipes TaxID=41117 RepID=UPI0018855365|nr:prosaposin-like isoform X2 [Pollicipes pollicipes]
MALKVLILATLVGAAVCGPTIVSRGETGRVQHRLGSKKCTFGPSYWCDHISKSAECGMTSWCIDKVWNYMSLPEDNDDVCHICLDMVKEARDQLNSNETQEELKEVLEGSCNLLPIRLIAKECDELVDEFIPELVEVLSSQMNPQVVCQTAGLCNSPRVDKLLEDRSHKKLAEKPADACATCQQKTTALKQHVAAGGQQQLLDSLLPVCRDLGSYSDACAGDLAAHIDVIYQWVAELDTDGICLLGNACPGLFDETPLQLTATGPAVDCDLCIHIVKHWRDILVANTTKEEFKEILDGICSKTKAWAPKCTQLVNEYYEVIYDYLVNQMRAHTICKAIGLCSKPGQSVPLGAVVPAGSEAAAVLGAQPLLRLQPSLEMPLAKLTPPQELHTVALEKSPVQKVPKLHHVQLKKSPPRAYGNDGLAHPNPLEGSPIPAAEVLPVGQLPLSRLGLPDMSGLFQRNTELCDICEFGLQELRKVLMEDATEDELTEQVGRLCHLLPRTLANRCNKFVATYGDFIITMLAQEIDPSEVCPALRLCPLPDTEASLEESESSEQLSSEERVDEAPGCAICEYAMNTLLDYLKDKKTERDIRDALDRVCDMLPHTVSHECEELVNTFTEELIDMLVSGMTADEICVMLRLCVADAGRNDVLSNSIYSVPLLEGAGPSGMQFAGLAAPLAGLPVNSPRMPGQPEQLPAPADDEDPPEYLPARVKRPDLMASAEEEDDEDMEGEDDDDAEDEDEDDDRQSPVCVLCEFVMMQLKLKLDDNATDAEIEDALKHVCSYMPKSIEADCEGFVDEYGAPVLDAIKAAVADPDTVCAELQLCTAQRAADDGLPCEPCVALLTDLQVYAEDDGARDLSHHLSRFCVRLPGRRREQCEQLVEWYGPWVFSQLSQLVSPRDVCIGIDLCPRPPGTVHLMGGERCQWGPDYFCQDEFHARACNALQHCVEHVWEQVEPDMP